VEYALQRVFRRRLTLVAVNGSQQLTQSSRDCDCRVVANDEGRARREAAGGVALRMSSRDGIAEGFSAFRAHAMSRLMVPALLKAAQGRQQST